MHLKNDGNFDLPFAIWHLPFAIETPPLKSEISNLKYLKSSLLSPMSL
jgi:hypothetical protein